MTTLVRGICFEASPTRVDATDSEPKWNKLFPVDTTRYRRDFPGGSLSLSRDFLASMVGNWERMGKPSLPVDYSHNEAGKAAGWIESLELRDDGLYALIRWTEMARGLILADELRFLSPTFHPDAADTLTGGRQGPTLMGAGLLNNPFLFDLPRVAASASEVSPTHNPADEAFSQEQRMDKKLICAALGLPEDTADDVVMSTLQKRLSPQAQLSAQDVAEAVKLAAEPLKSELVAAKDANAKLTAKVEAMEAAKLSADVDAFLLNLEREGKLVPAARESTKQLVEKVGLEFARTHFASAPVVAPVKPIGHGSAVKSTDSKGAFVQLSAKADELIKAGVPQGDAMVRAMQMNPDLARAVAQKES